MARGDPLPAVLSNPQISLIGEVDKPMVQRFLDQLGEAIDGGGDVAMEISTLGGDAELARRMVLEIEDARRPISGRFLFLGKTTVYSAGVTIMSAFPRADRYLTRDAMVMIHGRQLDKSIEISGPMRASLPQIEAAREQVKTALAIEEEGFRRLIEGSDIELEELFDRALHNWYLTAGEALERGLVTRVLD